MEIPNPYAPPTVAVLDLPSPIRLKQRSVPLMIVFWVVTFGLYYVVWFFRRRKAFNALNSSKKVALWPLLLFSVMMGIELTIGVVSGDRPVQDTVGKIPMAVIVLLRIAAALLVLWQAFVVKDILEDHLTPATDGATPSMFVERVQLSGIAVFFLSIFYLQYTINRHLAGLQGTG